jgi:prepilin peptidase CpaA
MLHFPSTLLMVFLVVAVVIDHRHHRIPNLLTGSLLVTSFVLHGVLDGWSGLISAATGMLVGAAIFLIPYLKRGMAAGDVKLMAAVGACLGPSQALIAGCMALVVGGGFALLLLTYRYYATTTISVDALLQARFPYASSIAIGTAATTLIREGSWIL